jgi:hypothetical protein
VTRSPCLCPVVVLGQEWGDNVDVGLDKGQHDAFLDVENVASFINRGLISVKCERGGWAWIKQPFQGRKSCVAAPG